LLGLIVFAPVIYDAFITSTTTTIIISALWLMFSPIVSVYEYTIQAALLYLYYHVYSDSARAILIATGLALWYFEWMDLSTVDDDPITSTTRKVVKTTTPSPRSWGAACAARSDCPKEAGGVNAWCCRVGDTPESTAYKCSAPKCGQYHPEIKGT